MLLSHVAWFELDTPEKMIIKKFANGVNDTRKR